MTAGSGPAFGAGESVSAVNSIAARAAKIVISRLNHVPPAMVAATMMATYMAPEAARMMRFFMSVVCLLSQI